MDGGNPFPGRPPTTARHLADIEVLRVVAVLMVLDEHIPLNLVFWPSHLIMIQSRYARGWTGVDLFFAISGFVIARSLLPQVRACTGHSAGLVTMLRFWTRRAWRLLPSAWLWLLVPLAATLAFNRSGAFGPFQASYEAAIAAILQVANFHFAAVFGVRPSGVSFPYWSLSFEEQFYLVLPVAAYVLRRSLTPVLLLILALQFQVPHTPLAMLTRPGALAAGVLLALWERSPSWHICTPRMLNRSSLARRIALIGPIVLLTALGSDTLHIASFRLGLIALLTMGLVWIASYGRDFTMQPGVIKRGLIWIGNRSYALYLIHIPVYFAAHELWFRLDGTIRPHGAAAWAYAGLAFAVLFSLADLNYRFIEMPLRRHGVTVAARIGAEALHA